MRINRASTDIVLIFRVQKDISAHSILLIGMKMLTLNCKECNKLFEKTESSVKSNEKRGYFNNFCSTKCSCEFNKIIIKNLKKERELEYYKTPKICLYCKSPIPYKKSHRQTYCSSKCSATHSQMSGGHKVWTEEQKKDLSKKNSKILLEYYKKIPKERIIKSCIHCKCEFMVLPSKIDTKTCSRKCKFEWIKNSGHYKNKGRGGFRENSGTSKRGWYKGIFCGSSWELAWVIYHLENGIDFKRNTVGFEYTFGGKIRRYYPDFLVGDTFIEIKNYKTEQVEAKTNQFPNKLSVLYKKDLKTIFEYVEKKYGKDYIKLYDKI